MQLLLIDIYLLLPQVNNFKDILAIINQINILGGADGLVKIFHYSEGN
jgi:hypothetical protein